MSMQQFKTETDALICYNEFSGECFDKDGNLMVICAKPDDTGCLCDNGDDEVFVKLSELYIDENTYETIQDLKSEYH